MLSKQAHFGESGGDVMYRLLDCVIHAAPPGLPAMYIFISMVNITRLKVKGIRLGFPEALRLGAVATVACFDKTGTLTGSVVRMLRLPYMEVRADDNVGLLAQLLHLLTPHEANMM